MAIFAVVLSGCVTTKYHWGKYENSLYEYYKNPADVEKIAETLSTIIADGEALGNVPPGIYAEYGYILYITGKTQDSILYFEKEKKMWPESTTLMDKMINIASKSNIKNSEEKIEQPLQGGTLAR